MSSVGSYRWRVAIRPHRDYTSGFFINFLYKEKEAQSHVCNYVFYFIGFSAPYKKT